MIGYAKPINKRVLTNGVYAEGFRNFFNQKAVYKKGKIDLSAALFPPFGSKTHKLLAKVLIR